jgi:hypothetical protein
MSTSRLGTDSCRSVGLGWTPLVVGDPGWGQTLDSVNANKHCLLSHWGQTPSLRVGGGRSVPLGTDPIRGFGERFAPAISIGDRPRPDPGLRAWGQTLLGTKSPDGLLPASCHIGDRPHSWGFGERFAGATSVGDRPRPDPLSGFRMSTSRLGTDSCRSVGLGWTPLVVGDTGWGQTLDSVNGNKPCLLSHWGQTQVVEGWRGTKCLGKRLSEEPSRRVRYDRGAVGPRGSSRHRTFPGTYEIPSHRTLRDGLCRGRLSQALRTKLRPYRSSGTGLGPAP